MFFRPLTNIASSTFFVKLVNWHVFNFIFFQPIIPRIIDFFRFRILHNYLICVMIGDIKLATPFEFDFEI